MTDKIASAQRRGIGTTMTATAPEGFEPEPTPEAVAEQKQVRLAKRRAV